MGIRRHNGERVRRIRCRKEEEEDRERGERGDCVGKRKKRRVIVGEEIMGNRR